MEKAPSKYFPFLFFFSFFFPFFLFVVLIYLLLFPYDDSYPGPSARGHFCACF